MSDTNVNPTLRCSVLTQPGTYLAFYEKVSTENNTEKVSGEKVSGEKTAGEKAGLEEDSVEKALVEKNAVENDAAAAAGKATVEKAAGEMAAAEKADAEKADAETVLATRSTIADLVCMRTKLLKWSALRPHFTFKVSFSPNKRKVAVKL